MGWDLNKIFTHQKSLNRGGISLGVRGKLKPFMCFDYVTIYHSKMKLTEFNLKNIKNFRIEWR